ncbi:Redox-sensing transcriptional repressor Rex [Frankliniella fusca]|uniref:Redox-sensing transcriptional repressor Rex n=1 Tax=Frankliniella fusca TaxID=407009 RepID=A0AAE1H2K8_9NEOP|nr:Redox-sensing transcriptional repressor Rex [Frankliniella fusca]
MTMKQDKEKNFSDGSIQFMFDHHSPELSKKNQSILLMTMEQDKEKITSDGSIQFTFDHHSPELSKKNQSILLMTMKQEKEKNFSDGSIQFMIGGIMEFIQRAIFELDVPSRVERVRTGRSCATNPPKRSKKYDSLMDKFEDFRSRWD